jgi:predicted ATP-grasp superfamily ATP-dependent carboligase
MMNNKRVLVTYAWVRSSVAMARNLARRGLDVYIGDKQDVFMGKASRYPKGWIKYPNYATDPEAFVDCLCKFIREKEIGTYLPSHEEILVVAKYRDRFPASVKIPIDTYENLLLLFNKKSTYELAERAGVPYPKTYTFKDVADFRSRMDAMPEHGILKLQVSHGSHGIAIYKGMQQLRECWERLLKKIPANGELPVLQEYITAKIHAVSLLSDRGVVKAQFVRRNIREKEPFGGAAVKCESIHHPVAVQYASKLVQTAGFTGISMHEFLVDQSDPSRCWLMEINPRYWGTTSHDIDCGIEFPYYQYCMANAIPFTCPDYKDGLKSRWIVGDIISWRKSHKVAEHKFQNLRRYLDFDDDFFMDLKLDDLKPFLVEAWLYWKFRALL